MKEMSRAEVVSDYAKKMFQLFLDHRGNDNRKDLLRKTNALKRRLIKKNPGDVDMICDGYQIINDMVANDGMELDMLYTVEELKEISRKRDEKDADK